jgi:hypothetical protein
MAAADHRDTGNPGGWRAPGPRRQPRHADPGAVRVIGLKPAIRQASDRAHAWLRGAMTALAVLAVAAAAVSWDAQYVLVRTVKHSEVIAALEAGIPDIGALIFAALGIALALHRKRAIRPRTLNVACVGISLAMNALASAPGWRDLAIWVMPSALYALASDTLIGVVRAWAIARHNALNARLADEQVTPLAVLGGLALWLLRLVLAPGSTLAGFRRWVIEECPVAPGRRIAMRPVPAVTASVPAAGRARRGPRDSTKTARFLALVTERRGPLAGVPVTDVARISAELAPHAGLNTGAARAALRKAVLAAQNGSTQ